MSNLRFRNNSINACKRHIKTLKEKKKEMDDEFDRFFDSRDFHDVLNNIILTEVTKTVTKLAKKYGFDSKEALQVVLRNKITDSTPDAIRRGEDEKEDVPVVEDNDATEQDVYHQVMHEGRKYYHRNSVLYDADLKEVGLWGETGAVIT